MSSESCLLARPYSSQAGHVMECTSNSDASSDEVPRVVPTHQLMRISSANAFRAPVISQIGTTNVRSLEMYSSITSTSNTIVSNHLSYRDEKDFGQLVSVGSSPNLHSLQPSNDNTSDRDNTPKPIRRRNRSVAGVDKATEHSEDTDSATATNAVAVGEDERKPSAPQHEELSEQKGNQDESTPFSSLTPQDVDFQADLLTRRNRRVLISRLMEVAPRGKLSMVSFLLFEFLVAGYGRILCIRVLDLHLQCCFKIVLFTKSNLDKLMPTRYWGGRGTSPKGGYNTKSTAICFEIKLQ
jgi:hypothetical protein